MTNMATSALVPANFELVDHFGHEVSNATYRGRFALIFFGFTHCKAVCPRALSKLSQVLTALGDDAQHIQALYVTVDPERDTPEVMKGYLADRPAFTGLTGTAKQCEQARRAFHVFAARRQDPDDPDGYAMPHSAMTYVLDREGCYLTHFSDATAEEELVTQLRSIMTGSAAAFSEPDATKTPETGAGCADCGESCSCACSA